MQRLVAAGLQELNFLDWRKRSTQYDLAAATAWILTARANPGQIGGGLVRTSLEDPDGPVWPDLQQWPTPGFRPGHLPVVVDGALAMAEPVGGAPGDRPADGPATVRDILAALDGAGDQAANLRAEIDALAAIAAASGEPGDPATRFRRAGTEVLRAAGLLPGPGQVSA